LSRRPATGVLLSVALLAAGCRERKSPAAGAPVVAEAPSASVLLVTLDTLRPDALGWVSGASATPALDRLASGGLRFRAAVAPAPLTFPSHAAMMTGVLPRRLGLRDNGQTLGSEPETLAGVLRGRGFRTAAFVSGYPLSRGFGLDRGFETYDDSFSAGEGENVERPAAETTRVAVAWLAAARAPWFVWVHYFDPHFPYEPPAGFARPGARGGYDGEVAYADQAIADLLAAAERSAGRRLLTVFAGDHGESLGEHGEGTHGFFVYDATVLVPLVFRFPGVVAPRESRAPARLIDLAPTVVDLVGAPRLPFADGQSLARERSGQMPPAYVETWQPWLSYGWAPLQAVRVERWKLIVGPRPELYDLSSDPGEQKNVFDTQRDRARGLEAARRRIEALPPLGVPGGGADAEAVAKLRALGYVGAGGGAGEPPASGLRDPKDAAPLRELLTDADLRLRRGDHRGAVKRFDEVLAQDPSNRFALFRSGVALLGAGDAARAVPRLAKAVEVSPAQPEARGALAQALVRVGRPGEAVPHALEAARLQPRRAAAWADLGTALGQARRIPEAVEALRRAAALDPADPSLAARLGFALHAAGRIPDAVRELERAAGLSDGKFRHSGALGILLADLGRTEDARRWLAASVRGEGDFAEAKFRLALLEAARGAPENARRALAEAVAASPALRFRARREPSLARLLP
jgi:arylsulfatase A-like enzyme/Flp pilus assembly protein TadD